MSDCSKYQELICALVDEQLNSDDRAALMAHIADCPECRAMYLAFSAVSDAITEYKEDLPEGLHENIMAGVRRSAIMKKYRKRNSRQAKGLIMAAACFAVVIMSAVGISHVVSARQDDVITSRAQMSNFSASGSVSRELTPTVESAEASVPEDKSAAQSAPAAPVAPSLPEVTAAPTPVEDPTKNEYYSDGPREHMSPIEPPIQTVAPTSAPVQTPSPVAIRPIEQPSAPQQSGMTQGSAPQSDSVKTDAPTEAAPTAVTDAVQDGFAVGAETNDAAQTANDSAYAQAPAAVSESGEELYGIQAADESETPEPTEAPKAIGIFDRIMSSFNTRTGASKAPAAASMLDIGEAADELEVPEDTADGSQPVGGTDETPDTQPTAPVQTIPPLMSFVNNSSATTGDKADDDKTDVSTANESKKKADFCADITSGKDFEKFAKLLLGQLSKLPEGKPDKTYMFTTTYLDKVKNFKVIVYAYGDAIYFSVYDELIEQNIFLADCTQKQLEDFIKTNYPTPTPTPDPLTSPAPDTADNADYLITPDRSNMPYDSFETQTTNAK